MGKISPNLKEKLRSTSLESDIKFKLIISLTGNAKWNQEVRLLQEAGLKIDSRLEEIQTITGSANREAIQSIVDIPAVAAIELDEMVSIMGSDDPLWNKKTGRDSILLWHLFDGETMLHAPGYFRSFLFLRKYHPIPHHHSIPAFLCLATLL